MNGLIRWFAGNHVAANLLMVVIIVAGFFSAMSIKQEVFPEVEMDIISVQVPYLGATPSEVEEAICVRVEEQVQGVDGIKKITSAAVEGIGTVTIELQRGLDKRKALDEIKSEIENLTSKSISEVIAFALHVRDQRDSAAVAALKTQMDVSEPPNLLAADEFEEADAEAKAGHEKANAPKESN